MRDGLGGDRMARMADAASHDPPPPPTASVPPEPYASMTLDEALAVLPPPGRVGIVHDWLNGMRGGEKVLEAFLELLPGASIYTLFYEPENLSERISLSPVRASWLNRFGFARRRYRYFLPLFPFFMATRKFHAVDLLISTSHCVAKAALPPPDKPHISYVHSPMRYVWDLFDQYFGQGRSGWTTRTAMKILRGPLQRWDRRTCNRVTHFLCNSRHIAGKIEKFYDRTACVVPPPVDLERFRPAEGVPGTEAPWLVVSALVPYKRVDLAVEAAARRGERLIVAGRGPELGRLVALAGAREAEVEFLGWVSDEDLPALYASARGLLFPGEEDFGITPLESMAAGRPVVAFGRGGACETVIDGKTGVLFDQQTVDDLAEAMGKTAKIRWDAASLRAHAGRFGRDRFRLSLVRHLAWLYSGHDSPAV